MRVGAQTPRLRSVPAYTRTVGHEIVEFMAEIGRPLDPWQAAIVLDMFGLAVDGLWAAFEVTLLLARQNGKGGVTEARELGGLFLLREKLIMHSAHQFKTSTEAFRRVVDLIEANDWLTRQIKMISRSKGDEGIELTRQYGGGRLRFVARSGGSGRGFTGDCNVFDEAAYLTIAQYAAQTPTLATRPNPQVIYTSTPPDEDTGPMPEDAMLPSVRARGHGGDPRMAFYEWSPPPGYNRADPDVHYGCNPALGIRIQPWFLDQQLRAFEAAGKPGKFATEHLGEWPPDADCQWQVIGKPEWDAAADPGSQITGTVAFALDVSWDRRFTAVGVAGRRVDRLRHGELVAYQPGTGWVVPWIVERIRRWRPCAVVVQPGSPAASLIPDLEAAKVEVLTPSTAELGQACGALYDGIAGEDHADRNIRHLGDGELQSALGTAVAGLVRRRVGDAWLWDRQASAADICPLMAVTLALWGHSVNAPGEYRALDNIW